MLDRYVSDIELLLIFRCILAAVFGFMVGIERKGGKKGAGSRTFMLISMGSAAFTALAIHGFEPSSASARMAGQIITGVGFIGAGVIWKSESKERLHGLTTAAAIWVASAMGITIGLGFYYLGVVLTMMMMVILAKGHPLEMAKENIAFQYKGDGELED